MVFIKTCCCCLPLRVGCIFIGIFGVFMCVCNIWIITSLFHVKKFKNTETKHTALFYASELIMLVASVTLLFSTMTVSQTICLIFIQFNLVWFSEGSIFCTYLCCSCYSEIFIRINYSTVTCAKSANFITNMNIFACIVYWMHVTFCSCKLNLLNKLINNSYVV